ncbi:hypothetical protein SELMODRAFT_423440 [Selaginella moellendorffii]|uniref:Uncharacterized protein n=1 Tax=Selaginella moellendorffii TaxID=88036 RepID=D8SLQ5_SELML|nr:hypothetical protein SELMODRAFT_423440 [Selaginella moellendorffii]
MERLDASVRGMAKDQLLAELQTSTDAAMLCLVETRLAVLILGEELNMMRIQTPAKNLKEATHYLKHALELNPACGGARKLMSDPVGEEVLDAQQSATRDVEHHGSHGFGDWELHVCKLCVGAWGGTGKLLRGDAAWTGCVQGRDGCVRVPARNALGHGGEVLPWCGGQEPFVCRSCPPGVKATKISQDRPPSNSGQPKRMMNGSQASSLQVACKLLLLQPRNPSPGQMHFSDGSELPSLSLFLKRWELKSLSSLEVLRAPLMPISRSKTSHNSQKMIQLAMKDLPGTEILSLVTKFALENMNVDIAKC